MISATIKVRSIPDEAFQAILEMLQEEAKDVSIDFWSSSELPGYIPRQSAARRSPRAGVHRKA